LFDGGYNIERGYGDDMANSGWARGRSPAKYQGVRGGDGIASANGAGASVFLELVVKQEVERASERANASEVGVSYERSNVEVIGSGRGADLPYGHVDGHHSGAQFGAGERRVHFAADEGGTTAMAKKVVGNVGTSRIVVTSGSTRVALRFAEDADMTEWSRKQKAGVRAKAKGKAKGKERHGLTRQRERKRERRSTQRW
jgi:hypothetical protein